METQPKRCKISSPGLAAGRKVSYIGPAMSSLQLKENYILANCCHPRPPEPLIGYFSHDGVLKVHKEDCPNLQHTDRERLVGLKWAEILAPETFQPDDDFDELDETDFGVLRHHGNLGIDYSLKLARDLNIAKETAFERHRKLSDMGLIERVEPTMVQYRKGVVDHKWIKHRNHTYYDLTPKGKSYLEYHEGSKS